MTKAGDITVAEIDHLIAVRDLCHKASVIDELEERHWFDMIYGFLMGRGVEPGRAMALASSCYYGAQLFDGSVEVKITRPGGVVETIQERKKRA